MLFGKCVVSPAAMYSHALCIIMAIHPPQGDIFKILKWDLQVIQMVFQRWFWLCLILCWAMFHRPDQCPACDPLNEKAHYTDVSQVLTQIWLLIQWTSPGIETRGKSEWAQHVFFYLLSLRIEQNFFNHLRHSRKSKEDHQLGEHIPKLEITWKIEMY